LLGDRTQSLPVARGVFGRDESQIAGDLPAVWKSRDIADGHSEGQRRNRTHARMGLQKPGSRMLPASLFRSIVQLRDLLVQLLKQGQQIRSSYVCPAIHRHLPENLLPGPGPQPMALLHAPVEAKMLQTVL